MTFLNSIKLEINNIPIVIYRNTEALELTNEIVAKEYVTKLINANSCLTGRKIVAILWKNVDKKMADCWVFGKNESDLTGAEVSVYLFNEMEIYQSPTVSAADGLAVLGEEAKELLNR